MRNSRGTFLSVLSFQPDIMETFRYLDKMYIYQLDNGKSNKENDSSLIITRNPYKQIKQTVPYLRSEEYNNLVSMHRNK